MTGAWSVCEECGVVVADPTVHETWHEPDPPVTPEEPEEPTDG